MLKKHSRSFSFCSALTEFSGTVCGLLQVKSVGTFSISLRFSLQLLVQFVAQF
jgi:hypothetical protein